VRIQQRIPERGIKVEKIVAEKAYAKKNAPRDHVSTRAKECVVTLHFSDILIRLD